MENGLHFFDFAAEMGGAPVNGYNIISNMIDGEILLVNKERIPWDRRICPLLTIAGAAHGLTTAQLCKVEACGFFDDEGEVCAITNLARIGAEARAGERFGTENM